MPASVAPPAPTRTRSSRHELEPNPFEQSFRSPKDESATGSNSSAAGNSPSRAKRAPAKTRSSARNVASSASGSAAEGNVDGEAKDQKKAAAPATPSAATAAAGGANAKASAATTAGHTLPGVASLTSPSDGNNPFNWATGSLRTGPLSPAMLGGPSGSHQGFDPNTFRTGFTPDLSNFKTGLTPLGAAGINFPPPSPNTAAFLATIGASSAGGSAPGTAAPITPNTLAALTGNATGLADTTAPGGAGGHRADIVPQPFDYAFSRSMTDKPTSRLRSSTAHEDDANQSVSPEMINNKPLAGDARGNGALGHRPDGSLMQPPRQPPPSHHQSQPAPGGAQGDHNAASGLFLLSQAHQELSKREDADAAAAAHALTGIPRGGAPGGNPNGMGMYANGAAPPPPGAPVPSYKVTQGAAPPPKQAPGNAAAAAPKKTAGTKRKKGAKDAEESKGPAAAAAPAAPVAPPMNANSAASPASDKAPPKRKGAKKAKVNEQMFADSPAANGASGRMFNSDDEDDDGDSKLDGDGDDDEKRKNFLERNRQAALKCRQRKKAWLQSLQAKVEFLQQDNENLQNTVGALRNEVVYLKTQLMHANAQLLTAASANQAGAGGPPPPPPAHVPSNDIGPARQ